MTIINLLSDLVAIDSINPELVPDGAGESEISTFIANWCQMAGLEVHLQEVVPGRANVIAVARGSGGGRSLMLNAHVDTVGVAGMVNPHTPQIADGRVYGRGAYDMKAGLAACMDAIVRAKTQNLPGDVYLAAVVDEEYASIGTQAVVVEWSRWPADAVIVTEPTELTLCVAHKGFVWLEVETYGVAAHGSRPHLGVDAIAKMGRVLTGIEALDQSLRATPTHTLLKSGSLHASLISGGQEWSSYPAGCVLKVERRTLPGESLETVVSQVQAILDDAAAQDPAFRAECRVMLERAPFEVSPSQPIVQAVAQAAKRRMGKTPEFTGATFWMDAALFAEAGIPTVVFGSSGEGAHAAVEWVDIESVISCADILSETITQYCS